MLEIDGSYREGGGQILRSALALSLITGHAFRIHDIRGGRKRPGLMRQHLTALRAAARIGNARVEGDELGSTQVIFRPGPVCGGHYSFAVGTAGSTMLVLQTLLLPLLFAEEASTVHIEGGTHVFHAPSFDFVQLAYLSVLERMGASVRLDLERFGFFPAGGGKITAHVEPAQDGLGSLALTKTTDVMERRLRVINAHLPSHVAQREVDTFLAESGWPRHLVQVTQTEESTSPGNAVIAELCFETHRELLCELGSRGRPAEDVARGCARQVEALLEARVPVGPHLCDQLLLAMAVGEGGRIRTMALTDHSHTQMWLIPKFVNVEFSVREIDEFRIEVAVNVD